MSDEVIFQGTCKEESARCDACGCRIFEDTWRLIVIYNGKQYIVHDNEGICRDKMLVMLKLIEPTFLSTRPIEQNLS
jgi:hypothetical protein